MQVATQNQKVELQVKPSLLLSAKLQKTMAASFHARSNSLPSKPHPLVSQFDDNISRLRDSQATPTSSSSIGNNLVSLQNLHDCVDQLLLLPRTQQVLGQEHNRKCVDELLDGSLGVLDLCNTIKDFLLQTKDCLHELESVIRRRQGGFEGETKKYISSRKILKKTIKKALKGIENKSTSTSSNQDLEILKKMKEVEEITLATFKPMLCFISESNSESRTSGWSLVSKLMHKKRVACQEPEANTNEFTIVDVALESLIVSKTTKSETDVQKKLNSLDLCIQDLEDGIECLFRRMIKTRASFLNIFS